jgi:hypothetical protein
MVCYPKDWCTNTSLQSNKTGGFLLNNIYYYKYFVKSNDEHTISITDEVKLKKYFDMINKIQKKGFKLNQNLYEFYSENLSYIIFCALKEEGILKFNLISDFKIDFFKLEKYSKNKNKNLILKSLSNFKKKVDKEILNLKKSSTLSNEVLQESTSLEDLKDNLKNVEKEIPNLKSLSNLNELAISLNKVFQKYTDFMNLTYRYKDVKNKVFYFPLSIDC